MLFCLQKCNVSLWLTAKLFLCMALYACAFRAPAQIEFTGADGAAAALNAHSKKAVDGVYAFNTSVEYTYSFDTQQAVPENSSLEVEYTIGGDASGGGEIAVQADEGTAWMLPVSFGFLEIAHNAQKLRYNIPLTNKHIKSIHIKTTKQKDSALELRIERFNIVPRVFGFSVLPQSITLSPFVKKEGAYIISVPDAYKIDGRTLIVARGLQADAVLASSTKRFKYVSGGGGFTAQTVTFPSAILGPSPLPIAFEGEADGLYLAASQTPAFPLQPRTADPYFILNFPKVSWRDERYEVYRWESFPSILIFDTLNYDIQDRMLKRLAFFAEKKGFRGRLASDGEIAELHGWNAHDYNAQTLAAFFSLVKKQKFRITQEEDEMRQILLANGVIRETEDGVSAGEGAMVSISRQSNEYLRLLFMAHEGFHGIFFIDEDFRTFCAERWKNLNRTAKNFIVSYFDYQQYDVQDNYLLINEFMAHILQQSAGAAAEYFGKTLAGRIDASDWRRSVLPPKDDATETWPALAEAFSAEAYAFSAYARRRWGLDCGRIWRVRPAD
jgi:hypothetical protein